MRLYLFLATLLLASSFSAAQFSIGSPAPNTRIQRGAQFIVTWGGLTANATAVTIDLMQGTADALLLKEILASNIPAESGRTTLTTPDTITSANNYFIRIRANDIPSSVATQGPIAIFAPVASSSGAASSAAPSNPAPTSASSSAAASSSSAARSSTAASSASATSTNSAKDSKTSSVPRETSPSDSDGNTGGNDSTLSSGAIAGIAIGAVAGIGVVSLVQHGMGGE
ncbi:hypothetical protein BJV82DRAFT_242259 [Fennellomyces sp. T-0311]|nr:hypothetical protein BJV82DRAFT_242259 [Fennellomyces sp. T-0311]